MRAAGIAAAATLACGCVLALSAVPSGGRVAAARSDRGTGAEGAGLHWPPRTYPGPASVRSAIAYAAGRSGVSFALFDSRGRLHGYDVDRPYSSASASKALLLAAELRRLRAEGQPLDEGTRSTLAAMITYSDNGAAGATYAQVGDAGMEEVAHRAGMRSFAVTPGFWGGAQITAADMARFYSRLNRNLVGPHRRFARHLLASVTSLQRWGIPAVAGRDWRVWFKGGWRPPGQEETSGPVTHQAALLRHPTGARFSLAVLTDYEPTELGGIGAIEEVTRRLLSRPPAGPSLWRGV